MDGYYIYLFIMLDDLGVPWSTPICWSTGGCSHGVAAPRNLLASLQIWFQGNPLGMSQQSLVGKAAIASKAYGTGTSDGDQSIEADVQHTSVNGRRLRCFSNLQVKHGQTA